MTGGREEVVLTSDIEEMFHQVRVPLDDQDMLRFLWWPEGNVNGELSVYHMKVHIFGATSSPSCASYAVNRTAEDNQDSYPAEVIQTIKRNIYVDDCLKAVPNDEKAISLAKDLRAVCDDGGFKLTKWGSNSRPVLRTIPEEDLAKDVKGIDLERGSLPIERVLGVEWLMESDTFRFRIVVNDKPATRRGLLSIVSSIFDPHGFVAPFVLTAKVLLQELCDMKLGWDEDIPPGQKARWLVWLKDLPKLVKLHVQ
ncbi:PREDICTED: uncharacterized protein LOC106810053 [Priapulus caudatus]|uniref:Uncharacterized protein LOC106810053 n=1 Tax=Priapulus caudatus TaxID=37621 RepID=A0ABM1E9D3_PRICU|nr:PREDICTED: uncharacterized protein LOC106810053 [Priapulus caudatus]